MQKILIDVHEVAELLGEKNDAVYRLAREGILPHCRLGRKIKFSPKEIEKFIEKGGQGFAGGWKKEA